MHFCSYIPSEKNHQFSRYVSISLLLQIFIHYVSFEAERKDKKGGWLTCEGGSRPWFSIPTEPGVQCVWRDAVEHHHLHHYYYCWTNRCLTLCLHLLD